MSNTYVRVSSLRPLGVAILAVLIGILGALFLVGSIILFLVVFFASAFAPNALWVFGPGLLGAVLLLIFGVVLLVIARGLWDLEMWALVLSFIVLGVAWISDVVQGLILSLTALLLLALLVYLFLVRRHFR
ncbi:MAG: hypothetical protein ACREDK_05290 [Thermoplasmata archaeon]